jgi:hypothetical protein
MCRPWAAEAVRESQGTLNRTSERDRRYRARFQRSMSARHRGLRARAGARHRLWRCWPTATGARRAPEPPWPVTSAPMLTRRHRPGRHASRGLLRIGGLGRSPCRSCVVRGRTGFADESDSRYKRRRARTPRTSWERERCRVTRGRAAAARRVIRTRGQTAACFGDTRSELHASRQRAVDD